MSLVKLISKIKIDDIEKINKIIPFIPSDRYQSYYDVEQLYIDILKYQGYLITIPLMIDIKDEYIKSQINLLQYKGLLYHIGVIIDKYILDFGSETYDESKARFRILTPYEFLKPLDKLYIKNIRLFKPNISFFDMNNIKLRANLLYQNNNQKYDILNNNCEHFANYIVFGNNFSLQSDILNYLFNSKNNIIQIFFFNDLKNMINTYKKYYTIITFYKIDYLKYY